MAKAFKPSTKLERDLVSYVRATRVLLELLSDLSAPAVPEAKPATAPAPVQTVTKAPAKKRTKRTLGTKTCTCGASHDIRGMLHAKWCPANT